MDLKLRLNWHIVSILKIESFPTELSISSTCPNVITSLAGSILHMEIIPDMFYPLSINFLGFIVQGVLKKCFRYGFTNFKPNFLSPRLLKMKNFSAIHFKNHPTFVSSTIFGYGLSNMNNQQLF